MREWEEVRIQQIVDIVNTPIEFPALPLGMKVELDPSMPVGRTAVPYPATQVSRWPPPQPSARRVGRNGDNARSCLTR